MGLLKKLEELNIFKDDDEKHEKQEKHEKHEGMHTSHPTCSLATLTRAVSRA